MSDPLERKRRAEKAAFKRFEDTLKINLVSNRTISEVQVDLQKLERKYHDCEMAHDAYCATLDEAKYEPEEDWMMEIEQRFNAMRLKTNDYVMKMRDQLDPILPASATGAAVASSPIPPTKIHTEKLPYPKFSGKISEYLLFKRDWCDVVEARFGRNIDTLFLLKRSVSESVRRWIETGSNYSEAWRILDEQYGNPRWISDQLVSEIRKMGSATTTNQFVELYHACSHAQSVLSQLNRVQDLDNSTFLGILEKKLTFEDRGSWAKHQRKEKIEPSVKTLLKWMDDQIWVKRVAGAEIRGGQPSGGGTKTVFSVEGEEIVPESDKNDPPPLDNEGLVIDEEQAMLLCGFTAQDASYKPAPCWVCDSDQHRIDSCPKFKSLSPDVRLEKTREKRACFFCLRRHRLPCTRQRTRCPEKAVDGGACPYFHHPLLHGAKFEKKTDGNCAQLSSSSNRLLPIVTAVARNEDRNLSEKVNCLVDSGSQLTLIRDSVARKLKFSGEDMELEITGVGGVTRKHKTKIYTVTLVPICSGKTPVNIQAIGIPEIGQNKAKMDKSAVAEMFEIAECSIHRDEGPVDVLIGVDFADFHTGPMKQVNQYVLRETVLGVLIFGRPEIGSEKPGKSQILSVHAYMCGSPADITRFWDTEELGVTLNWCCQQRRRGERLMTATEKRDEAKVRSTAKKIGNRWQMLLPWGRDPNNLPNNYIQAFLKLLSLEKRLSKNEEYAKMYNQQVEDLVKAGSARVLTQEELDMYEGPVHYMSHHAVLRTDKPSTPCRMVFNQKESYKGHVINKYLKKCGDHLNNLIGVLLRWREHTYVLVADVRKMYHQVLTCPGIDQNTHRFLWRNFETDRAPDVYVKTVLTFGDVSSPALANIALDMTADEYQEKYPEASAIIKQNRYMDDFADSFRNVSELKTRKKEIDEILASGHFAVKKWITNANLADQAGGGRVSDEKDVEKVLGVLWSISTDCVSISMNIPSSIAPTLTKRTITGIMAGIYDVFGFGAPVVVNGKIKLQNLWRLKIDWDDRLSENLENEWAQWLDEVRKLKEMNFDRALTPSNAVGNPDLVIFCDASKLAFGGVAYCRYKLDDGTISTSFVMAKSRVAPLKTLSLPRLELQSVLVGSRLYDTVRVESRLNFENVHILTDSLITYSWILNDSRLYTTAVATRTGEILSKTERDFFAHCPSSENVCDDLSRGLKTHDLAKRWINGPEFLKLDPSEWPISRPEPRIESSEEEKLVGLAMSVIVPDGERFTALDRVQPWKKLIRVVARIHRYANNFRARKQPGKFTVRNDELSATELTEAKQTLIILAQKSLGERSRYQNLSPFVDEKGIVRVGGRVGKSEVSYDQIHPVLLPQNHPISKLIVLDTHMYGHPAPASTSARIRQHYWIIGVQRLARSVAYRCIFCRQIRAKTEDQFMAALPPSRLIPAPPFTHCAIDLFGPYKVRIRPRVMMSVWGVIITCLGTRAVYCDIVLDYSAMELIQTLRRFLSLRGTPQTMMSDQGSQLVKASKEIRVWCAARQMEWSFVTPNAAHQNSCAESLIKSVKRAYKAAVGDTILSAFEMQTVLFEMANLVNERPIGVKNTHPDDGSYISPNGILLGRASHSVPHGPFAETRNPRHRVEFVQKIIDAWWQKWYRDVFPLLTVRKKWHAENRNVKVDDLVLLLEPNPLRGHWTRARITRVFPGADGRVRNVELKTKTGVYERPITKISMLLPIEEQ